MGATRPIFSINKSGDITGFKHIQASSVREKSKKSDLESLNIRKILKVCLFGFLRVFLGHGREKAYE